MKKTFEIDFDSVNDCKKLLNIMKSRISELKKRDDPSFISKNDKNKLIFNACYNIWNTDIDDVYVNVESDEERKYYVYAHCDSSKKLALKKEGKTTFAMTLGMEYLPFYIGKGTGNRAFELNRNETHRKYRQKLNTFNTDVKVQIIKDNLTEKQALMYESKLIDIFGLITTGGYLVNLDEGVRYNERRNKYINDLRELSLYYKNSL